MMNKKIASVLLVGLLSLSIVSCGSGSGVTIDSVESGYLDAEKFDYENADLSQYVTLGVYEGLSAVRAKVNVTEAELDTEIENLLSSYGHYEEKTDCQVKEGDTVRADYTGYLDGVAFEGGTATDQEITAASNTGYIPGFAEAFIGQMTGVEFAFDVTFPEDYGNADMAGKEVTFVCTAHAVLGDELIIPELTDAFVSETFGYTNVEEFRILFRDSVETQRGYENDSAMYSSLWTQIVENSTVKAYPDGEVDRLYNESRSMYEYYAEMYGVDYDTFLSTYVGVTDEQLKTDAELYVKEDLVLYSLIDVMGTELTDEEYSTGRDFLAEMYAMTPEEFETYYGEDAIRATLNWEDVMKAVAAVSNITEE
ncbi:MAG: FKBP-type peptidyl-prolyl cis-trans isomerase [Clostridia bacterium]|nr:FKBP-type peptidyl-prolyl cis-trans isomerase [Clostridia bacterium]